MPKSTYLKARTAAYAVTGADAVDLMSSSSYTVDATDAPLAHPPHAHAHIHRDGFEALPLDAAMQDQYRNEIKSLKNIKHPSEKARTRLARLQALLTHPNWEALHLDPAYRQMIDFRHRIADPAGGRYIDRAKHSQFEDTEIAAMALVYELNTEAGKAAMDWLDGDKKRVVIKSRSAARALAKGPIDPAKTPGVAPSAHTLRGQVAQVIERGKGTANVAPTNPMAINGIVSVFDYQAGEVVLTTHYPISVNPLATDDEVTFKDFNPPGAKTVTKYAAKSYTSAAPGLRERVSIALGYSVAPTITWSESATICSVCAAQHGMRPSVFRHWTRCNRCGAVYCPAHAQPANQCSRPRCGGTTARI